MSSIEARRRATRRGVVVSRCAFETLETRRLLSGQVGLGASAAREIDLPRNLTADEAEWLKTHPLGGDDGGTVAAPSAPPSGPIDPVAEYEPMEGLVISWEGHTTILTSMTKRVTDAGGRMYINVDTASEQASATTTLQSQGVNMANVTFRQVTTDSVWIRDYGPRYVYEGGVRVITDHQYNRPRPNDNLQPNDFAAMKQHKYYEIGLNGTTLVHGGGNYHLNATGDAYSTMLIANENPSFTQQQIQQIWSTYENNDTTITSAFPTTVDLTQHIDMWMQIYDDNKVFIGDFANPSGSVATADGVADTTAALMQSRGYQVTRLPSFSIGGTHYTFTNMVLFNDIVLLPEYDGSSLENPTTPNPTLAAASSEALSLVQQAMPGKTVFQIDADTIVGLAGVFHCIEQHIPLHQGLPGANGGLAPTAYLRGPNNGETLEAGQAYQIEWITDDDAPVAAQGGVAGVDILLSTDGGQTFDFTVATNQPALGSYMWTVPGGIDTSQAVLRAVARDGSSNTGFDDTDVTFTITDPVPAVATSAFAYATSPHALSFSFSRDVSASLGTDDLIVENLTTSQTIPATDLSLAYDANTNTATFTYTPSGGVLPDGNYRATLLAAGVTTPGGTPMSADHTLEFLFMLGDADNDGIVNLSDFNILANNFGQSGRDYTQADFTYDGVVNLDDFNILANRFGTGLARGTVSGKPVASSAGQSRLSPREAGDADESEDLVLLA